MFRIKTKQKPMTPREVRHFMYTFSMFSLLFIASLMWTFQSAEVETAPAEDSVMESSSTEGSDAWHERMKIQSYTPFNEDSWGIRIIFHGDTATIRVNTDNLGEEFHSVIATTSLYDNGYVYPEINKENIYQISFDYKNAKHHIDMCRADGTCETLDLSVEDYVRAVSEEMRTSFPLFSIDSTMSFRGEDSKTGFDQYPGTANWTTHYANGYPENTTYKIYFE